MNCHNYLERILLARVYDVAVETPLEEAPGLSRRTDNRMLLKREDWQPVFSFKLRGAYNKMSRLSPAELARGVVAASAGNHAQGVAYSARRLGCEATIVMPVTTPRIKVDAVASLGGVVMLAGESYSDAYARAQEIVRQSGCVFIPPFDDPDVIAGQGTIALEILRDLPLLDMVVVPAGGGGLLAGMACCIKEINPRIQVVGVQAEGANAIQQCFAKKNGCRPTWCAPSPTASPSRPPAA